MRLVKLNCPNCGASLKVEDNKKEFYCKYCRTTSLLDDEVIRVEHTIVDEHAEEKLEIFNGFAKVFKGIGITSMVYFGIIIVVVIGVIGGLVFNISKMNNRRDEIFNDNSALVDVEFDSKYSEVEIRGFNGPFEMYSGTQSVFFVESLLDKAVTNNKTEKEHIITVIYDDITTTVPDEIVSIKHSLEDDVEYEVSLDYDEDGFVNKITLMVI